MRYRQAQSLFIVDSHFEDEIPNISEEDSLNESTGDSNEDSHKDLKKMDFDGLISINHDDDHLETVSFKTMDDVMGSLSLLHSPRTQKISEANCLSLNAKKKIFGRSGFNNQKSSKRQQGNKSKRMLKKTPKKQTDLGEIFLKNLFVVILAVIVFYIQKLLPESEYFELQEGKGKSSFESISAGLFTVLLCILSINF